MVTAVRVVAGFLALVSGCGPAVDCPHGECSEQSEASGTSTSDSLLCVDEQDLIADIEANAGCERVEDCGAFEVPCFTGPPSVCGKVAVNALFGLPSTVDAATQCENACEAPDCAATWDCIAGKCTMVELGTCEDALAEADAFIEAYSACEADDECFPLGRQCYPAGHDTCDQISLNSAADTNAWNRLSYALSCTQDCDLESAVFSCPWGCVDGRCRVLPL